MEVVDIVKQIHFDFDNAVNDIKIFSDIEVVEEHIESINYEVLKRVGFVNNPIVKQNKEIETKNIQRKNEFISKKRFSTNINKTIGFYGEHFPLNKFIFLPQVLNICEKYNLKIAKVKHFKGGVPDKNINDINNFLKRYDSFKSNESLSENNKLIEPFIFGDMNCPLTSMNIRYSDSYYNHSLLTDYYICAPLDDFEITDNTMVIGSELFENFMKKPKFKYIKPEVKKIPDPIILKPVRVLGEDMLGFLIITAWGDEAGDPNVINQNFN